MESEKYLASLGELEELERLNGHEFTDLYTVAYMRNLRSGMSDILAHFEALIEEAGGEENVDKDFLAHAERHRGVCISHSSESPETHPEE